MRTDRLNRLNLHIIAIIAFIAILFVCTSGYQISFDASGLSNDFDSDNVNVITRVKRQIEDLDTEEYPTTANEEQSEEPGFWDRVVKVALKLFSKFIEWLNSS